MSKDKHSKPCGPLESFYFGASAQYKKGERITVTVNGFSYEAVVGAKNTFPKEVVDVLRNCQSRTTVPDVDRYDPTRRGMPRKQEDFFNPATTVSYQCDFDIETIETK
ncbi:MAG: hypothetical protein ACRCZI_06605 [Cetobacterium sp.]